MYQYIRGSYHDVDVNRALTHWLSCAKLPYNVHEGGAFMNWCYKMKSRLDSNFWHNSPQPKIIDGLR